MNRHKFRVIAIYLPQYHPFPENDEWWGKGFTEWTNVTKARPRFKGHYQPHLPADLGFYDLRVPEVREQQAKMAKEAGIYGFCYYHYWFNGKLLMDRPLKEVLESGKPDFPFMICWANENWTRAWDGGEKQILIRQDYTDEDAIKHILWLMPYLKDPRYIRIDNKPVIAIYRSTIIPNIENMLKIWRQEAKKEGFDLYIARFESHGIAGREYLQPGFDAAIDFQPLGKSFGDYWKTRLGARIYYKINQLIFNNKFPRLINYKRYIRFLLNQPSPDYKQYPCVSPMWDNTSRRKRNIITFTKSSPQLYGEWLRKVLNIFIPYSNSSLILE